MKIIMIGAEYVGLVSGVCFAELGHDVICVDVDTDQIDKPNAGVSSTYEPGLTASFRATAARRRTIPQSLAICIPQARKLDHFLLRTGQEPAPHH